MLTSSACEDILGEYIRLDSDANSRTVTAWKPVICDIYSAYSSFSKPEFVLHLDIFYTQAVEVLGMDQVEGELRRCLESFFRRVGEDVIFSKTNGKRKL